jgi:hypothetical protein
VGHVLHSVASGMQNVNVIFFTLRWDGYELHKKSAGTRYAKLVFLHLVGSVSHVVHSVHPSHEMSMHYFSCLGGTGLDSRKNCNGTYYAEVVFLHLVGSAGHVVYCGASGAPNVDALFFFLGWDPYRFH